MRLFPSRSGSAVTMPCALRLGECLEVGFLFEVSLVPRPRLIGSRPARTPCILSRSGDPGRWTALLEDKVSTRATVVGWRQVAFEVVVIVASILMAFGIDAWWDHAQARAAERRFLERVQAELTEARQTLSNSLVTHRQYAEVSEAVLDYAVAGADIPPPTVEQVIRVSRYRNSTHLRTGVLDGAIASAELGLVSDPALRGLLAAWPGTLEEFTEEEEWIREFTGTIRLSVARHFDFSSLLVGTDPENIRVTPVGAAFLRSNEGRNLVGSRLQMEVVAVQEGEILLSALDELLDELGVQLGGG